MRPAIEQLEDLVRRYEARKSASGTRETLSDDIKSASLELLVPTDLEKHLIPNKNRLTSYALMKQEIELVVESSVGSKGSIARPGQASSSSGPQPVDVDAVTQWIASLVKGKGKGKSKGKPNDSKGKGKEKEKIKVKVKTVKAQATVISFVTTVARKAARLQTVGVRRRIRARAIKGQQ